jgi:hypothetical protein
MHQHVVKLGECLESIAERFGFSWESLWNSGDNADLKKLRHDPNLLYPGDIVFVPGQLVREESAKTGARHRFKCKNSPSKLNIQLLENGDPLANEPYKLLIDGQFQTGQTDVKGKIQVEIHPSTRKCHLTLTKSDKKFILQLGYLGPLEEVTGYQARLQNLGYYQGRIDGIAGKATVKAIASFQRDNDLDDTGKADQETLKALQKAHGV